MAVAPGGAANGTGRKATVSASKGSGPVGPAGLTISGCCDDVVGPIIRGTYSLHSENHAKPVYRKDEKVGTKQLEVMLYFWHDADSPDFSGWWFGPKVGGDQVWAYHPDCTASSPPSDGWQCPFDGPVDSTILVCPRAVSSQAAAASPSKDAAKSFSAKASAPASVSRLQDDSDQKRREQKAVLAVGRMVQKLKLAKPENLEALSAEREALLAAELPQAGSQRQRLRDEADKALALAKQRVDQINEHIRKADEQKQVKEQTKKEKEAKALELFEELSRLVEVAEKALADLSTAAATLNSDAAEVDVCSQALYAADEELVKAHQACSDFTAEKRDAIDQGPPRKDADKKAQPLISRVEAVLQQRSLILATFELSRRAATERQKASQLALQARQVAQVFLETQKATFTKYDVDHDGKLNRREIHAYAKGMFDFEVPSPDVERLLRTVAFEDPDVAVAEGVQWKDFQRLKVAVGVAREVARDTRRGAEKQECLDALLKLLDGLKVSVAEIEALVQDVRHQATHRGTVGQANDATSAEFQSACDDVSSLIESTEKKVSAVQTQLEETARDDSSGPSWLQHELENSRRQHTSELLTRVSKLDSQLRFCQNLRNSLRMKAQQKFRQEGEALHSNMVEMLRTAALEAADDAQRSADADLDLPFELGFRDESMVSRAQLEVFVRSRPADHKLPAGAVVRWLGEVVSPGAESVARDDLQQLLRVCWKVTKATVLTNGFGIKDSAVSRRLDVDEIIEAIGPAGPKDEDSGAKRLYGRAVRDGLLGYVTVRGNQGTTYLELAGTTCVTAKETSLFDAMTQEARELRKLKPGETLDMLVHDTKDEVSGCIRLKVRARSDGAVGWVSRASKDGGLNIKPS